MARSRIVTVNEKSINVQERRIGELEQLVKTLFPESKGKIANIDLSKLLEGVGFELLYDKLPKIFPEITKDDVKNAYFSELEALMEAFVDVNFFGLKKLVGSVAGPLVSMIQAGMQPKAPGIQPGLPQK